MSTDQRRQPAGTPTGGQFATDAHGEPPVALDVTPPDSAAMAEARATLARLFDVDPDEVAVTADSSHACGRPSGSAWITATVPPSPRTGDMEVQVAFTEHSSGATSGGRASVAWEIDPTLGYETDATGINAEFAADMDDSGITTLLRDTLAQAYLQRELDTSFNHGQMRANKARRRDTHEILSLEARVRAGRESFVITDRRALHQPDLHLTVNRGRIEAGSLGTQYGTLNLQGRNLDIVVQRLARDASLADAARPAGGDVWDGDQLTRWLGNRIDYARTRRNAELPQITWT